MWKPLILRINTLKAYWIYTARLDTKVSAILYVQCMCIFCEVRTESLSIIWISVFQSRFRQKLINSLAFYMLPFSFLSTYILILSSYEYEVTLKKGILYFYRKYFRKKQVEHYKTATFSNSLHLWIWIFAIGYDKTKYRNKLDTEADLRLEMSSIILDAKLMCSSKQPHPSR
jgi:hypothetical protein